MRLVILTILLALAACRQQPRKGTGSGDLAARVQKVEAENARLRSSAEKMRARMKNLEAENARLRKGKCSAEQVSPEAEWALRRSLRVATNVDPEWSLVRAVKQLYKTAKHMADSGSKGRPGRVQDALDQLTASDYSFYQQRLQFKGLSPGDEGSAEVVSRKEWKLYRYVKTLADDYGFFKSIVGGDPVDRRGQAIPFYSYPALEFFDHMDLKTATVLEFGAGMSTIWWAKRAQRVVSLETNPEWFAKLKDKIAEEGLTNIDVLLAKSHEPPNKGCPTAPDPRLCYIQEPPEKGISPNWSCGCDGKNNVLKVEPTLCGTQWEGKKFDVVIVDQAANRYSLSRIAGKLLSSRGVVILDNTEMYPKSAHLLREQYDLAQIDFFGLKANSGEDTAVTTSLFLSPGAHELLKGRRYPMIYDSLPIGAGFGANHAAQKFRVEKRNMKTLNTTMPWDEDPTPGLDGEGQCKIGL